MKRAPRWLAIIVAVIGILSNLPAMLFGLSLLWNWIRLHASGSAYFHYSYFHYAVLWFLVSTLGMAAAAITIWKQNTYDIFPALSVIVGLICMVALPNVSPRLDLAGGTTKLIGHADHSLSDWDESHGRFPSDERELRDALAVRPLSEPAIFFRDGKPIPYDVKVLTNAVAPKLELMPPNPGTIVYAVNSDYKEYWLVISTLQTPVGGPVVLHHIAGDFETGQILVLNRRHHNPGEGYQPFME